MKDHFNLSIVPFSSLKYISCKSNELAVLVSSYCDCFIAPIPQFFDDIWAIASWFYVINDHSLMRLNSLTKVDG